MQVSVENVRNLRNCLKIEAKIDVWLGAVRYLERLAAPGSGFSIRRSQAASYERVRRNGRFVVTWVSQNLSYGQARRCPRTAGMPLWRLSWAKATRCRILREGSLKRTFLAPRETQKWLLSGLEDARRRRPIGGNRAARPSARIRPGP